MALVVIFLCLTYLSLSIAQNCPEQGISSHRIYNDGKYRLTTLQRGDFILQSLMSFTRGYQSGDCGEVTDRGLVMIYAMKYAINRVNSNKTLNRWGKKLGLQLDNVCKSLPLTMARGIEVVSLHRPNSVCRADFLKCDYTQNISASDVKPATAIIGTAMSSTSIPLASLMSLYHIPQISYAASSRLLSKKDLYKSFFRTIPSDTNQISVMLEIIETFQWNYVFAIGSDDDYGKLGVSELKQIAQGKNICIAHDEYIPRDSPKTDEKIDKVIEKIEAKKSAKVVILFCYVSDLGEKILRKAKSKGIERIWLTSESWNPAATRDLGADLKNQTVGIITVSLKSYSMPYLVNFMKEEIKANFHCDMWLQNFMRTRFKCKPEKLTTDGLALTGSGSGCPCKLADVVKELSVIPGTIYNLVDAVTAVAHGIHNHLEKVCPHSESECNVSRIVPKDLTKEMYKVSFTNEQGNLVSFDDQIGDPKYAYYTVENIQVVNGSYKYVPVGDWSDKRNTHRLHLDVDKIQWPYWFTPKPENKFPSSRCSDDCQPGSYRVGKQDCCWGCKKCTHNNYSSNVNAESCLDCGPNHHTKDHTKCILTPVKWLTINDAPGKAIIIITGVGFLITLVAASILIKYRKLIIVDDSSPHMITLCCVLIFFTFAYGVLHIIKPSQMLCQAVNSTFYLFIMFYTTILMVKTKFFTRYLMDHAQKKLRGSLLTAQMIALFIFMTVEAASIIAWMHIDKVQVREFKETQPGVFEKRLQCQVDTTAARYVSTFIPIIILIIATFCAFRERNMEHSFYEPKFLSFTCIALCIIIVAFMPTFQYVLGKYKAIVMAITMDLFGFTFMACLIFPKVYVAIMRHKRGAGQYPIKPGCGQQNTQQTITVPVESIHGHGDSMAETSISKVDNGSAKSIPNGDISDGNDSEYGEKGLNEVNDGDNSNDRANNEKLKESYEKESDDKLECHI